MLITKLSEEEEQHIDELYEKIYKTENNLNEDDKWEEYCNESSRYKRKIYDANFKKIANNADSIVQSALEEIDYAIVQESDFITEEMKKEYDNNILNIIKEGLMQGCLSISLTRHIEALKNDKKRTNIIFKYIQKKLSDKYNTDNIINFLSISSKPIKKQFDKNISFKTEKYTTTRDRISQKIFENVLIKKDDSPDMFNVKLDKDGLELAKVCIDYDELLKNNLIECMPKLTELDYGVYDSIISLFLSGNRIMSFDMIYRSLSGKLDSKNTIPDEAKQNIHDALNKFRGILKIKYEYKDKNGNDNVYTQTGPLLHFEMLTESEKVRGQIINGGIRLPDDIKFAPALLRWAKFNRNELDTRDIKLLNIPGLRYSAENQQLKTAIYRRLITMHSKMKHNNKELAVNLRTIRYAHIYEKIGVNADELTKDRRHDLKIKIDKCLDYWKKLEFIGDYQHKRDAKKGYYAIIVSLLPQKELEASSL